MSAKREVKLKTVNLSLWISSRFMDPFLFAAAPGMFGTVWYYLGHSSQQTFVKYAGTAWSTKSGIRKALLGAYPGGGARGLNPLSQKPSPLLEPPNEMTHCTGIYGVRHPEPPFRHLILKSLATPPNMPEHYK